MWQSTSYTEPGHVRQHNEDAVLALPEECLWLVADGMGGHSHGDYASQLVTHQLSLFSNSHLPGVAKQRLTRVLGHCNRELVEKAHREDVDIIGCTVAAMYARSCSVLITWSGDSRVYRLRNQHMRLLTRDHSQDRLIEDRDVLRHPHSYLEPSTMLTAAIGGDDQLSLEHCWYTLQPEDTFLLCTDGLYKELNDQEIEHIVATEKDGKSVLDALAAEYQHRGARDNVGLVWAKYTC